MLINSGGGDPHLNGWVQKGHHTSLLVDNAGGINSYCNSTIRTMCMVHIKY